MARTKNLNLTGRAASTQRSDTRRALFVQSPREIMIGEIKQIMGATEAFHNWYNDVYKLRADGKHDEYEAAIRRKLADLKLADVMDDPGASAIEQSDAIDRWMSECWATLPEIEL